MATLNRELPYIPAFFVFRQPETFAKPYIVLFVILTLNEVKGKNLYKTKNEILHFSAKSSE